MTFRKSIKGIVLTGMLVIISLLAGCATTIRKGYHGQHKEEHEVAVVFSSGFVYETVSFVRQRRSDPSINQPYLNPFSLSIIRVDGDNLPEPLVQGTLRRGATQPPVPGSHIFELLPGDYDFDIFYKDSKWHYPRPIRTRMHVRAGRFYWPLGFMGHNQTNFRIGRVPHILHSGSRALMTESHDPVVIRKAEGLKKKYRDAKLKAQAGETTTHSKPSLTSGTPQESDIARGLSLVSRGQYARAIPMLDSGLEWLTADPSYKASTDTLVSQQAEFISKLVEQLRGADQKGVFGSSNPTAQVVVSAIEAQAKVIKSIDDRRRSQTGVDIHPSSAETTDAQSPERATSPVRNEGASVEGTLVRPETREPVSGQTVFLCVPTVSHDGSVVLSMDGILQQTKTDAEGRFRMSNVPVGKRVMVSVTDSDGGFQFVTLETGGIKKLGEVFLRGDIEKTKKNPD